MIERVAAFLEEAPVGEELDELLALQLRDELQDDVFASKGGAKRHRPGSADGAGSSSGAGSADEVDDVDPVAVCLTPLDVQGVRGRPATVCLPHLQLELDQLMKTKLILLLACLMPLNGQGMLGLILVLILACVAHYEHYVLKLALCRKCLALLTLSTGRVTGTIEMAAMVCNGLPGVLLATGICEVLLPSWQIMVMMRGLLWLRVIAIASCITHLRLCHLRLCLRVLLTGTWPI